MTRPPAEPCPPLQSCDRTGSNTTPASPDRASGALPPHRTRRLAASHRAGNSGNSSRSKNNSTEPLDRAPISSVNVGPSPGNGSIQNSVTDHWLSTEEVSQRLQIPEKTLANWASLGKGPRFARMGRYRRYRFSDLLAWEEAQLELGESA
ncbi:helix-turn-helix domain-containing protein [Nocardia asiatica]|uniref:helix-turn-helix domain-containing protein n=1 Tax=Nocardia asiatica TaxID=209252 RepID=UPI0009FF9640|nr:helix-turn-helix domain-containing protein [Nocardia asiatica]